MAKFQVLFAATLCVIIAGSLAATVGRIERSPQNENEITHFDFIDPEPTGPEKPSYPSSYYEEYDYDSEESTVRRQEYDDESEYDYYSGYGYYDSQYDADSEYDYYSGYGYYDSDYETDGSGYYGQYGYDGQPSYESTPGYYGQDYNDYYQEYDNNNQQYDNYYQDSTVDPNRENYYVDSAGRKYIGYYSPHNKGYFQYFVYSSEVST